MDDMPVGLLADGVLHYIEPDHLGTPRLVFNPLRNVAIWTWDIKGELFGNTEPNQDPDIDGQAFVFDMRFPGQRYDAVSGLNYNYFRDYDPGTGRYVQSDPIGLGGGISTYAYVGGNPLGAVDRLGLWPVVLAGAQNRDDFNIFWGAWFDEDVPGVCIVYAHGAWTHISDTRAGTANKVRYMANSPEDMRKFNQLLTAEGCGPRDPVVLKSCNTGADPGVNGMQNVMTALSKVRGTEVSAPNRSVWYLPMRPPLKTPFGHVGGDIHGPININDPGEYRSVRP